MILEGNTTLEQQLIYREMARALRELAPALRHAEAREELELLAVRYQRLVVAQGWSKGGRYGDYSYDAGTDGLDAGGRMLGVDS